MALLVKISAMTDKINCKAGTSAECGFDLINSSDARVRVGVQAIGELKDKGWVKVQGAPEVDLPPKAQEKVKVSVTMPANAEARSYSFKLRVYDVQDPERAAESGAVAVAVSVTATTADVKPPPALVPDGKKPPQWPLIIGAIAGAVLLIGVLVTVLLMRGGDKVPDVTQASADAAQQTLTAAGYKVERATQVVEDTASLNKVIKTDPLAGQKLDKGSVVTMIVGIEAAKVPPAPPPQVPPKKCGDDLPYGVNTCIQGYVWREGSPTDLVCVPVQTRAETQQENAQAAQRRSPNGGPYGPDTCLQGFVWRDAFANDHVCVPGPSRSRAAEDNSLARSRRVCQ
jgi:hypothetical protein